MRNSTAVNHKSLLVVGSVAYDSVQTPAGNRQGSLGGSAIYSSVAGSYFAPVSLVAVVGEDFEQEHIGFLASRGIDISGLEQKTGKTFRWTGLYGTEDLKTRETLDTQLNVFASFCPSLGPEHRRAPYLFLANINPDLQHNVLDQMTRRPKVVGLDTMNFWIEGESDALAQVIEAVDVVFMDQGEARAFAGEVNIVRAAKRILELGPSTVVIKRGEHGAILFNEASIFSAPAFPLESVTDPTGAGDSFAGGFMGYLASSDNLNNDILRRATVLGSVMGSFAVESFSVDRLGSLTDQIIEERFRGVTALSQFSPLKKGEPLSWDNSITPYRSTRRTF